MKTSRMAAIVLVVLLLAYPLSIGPVTRYYIGSSFEDRKDWPQALNSFYKPLVWMCKVKMISEPMGWYQQKWYPKWYEEEKQAGSIIDSHL